MRFGTVAAFSLSLLLPLAASAQLAGTADTMTGEPFTVSVSPEFPAPYSQATLSFLSSSLDLANATLSVAAGGKSLYSGSVRPVPVTLGRSGGVTTVVVRITSAGASYSQSVRIQPQDVVLVAEPVSSAPPLYAGKPQVPLEGDVRVVALADLRDAQGRVVNPASVSYSWTVDDTRIANSSGIGKQAILVAAPLQYRSRDVSVVAMSQDGSLVGGASLSLSASEPSMRIYENDPLLGIRYERALSGEHSITGAELTLYAAPFSLPSTGGAPFIQWFLNGDVAQNGNSITLRPTGSGAGNASLSVVASAGSYSTVTQVLSILFGAQKGSNIFGL